MSAKGIKEHFTLTRDPAEADYFYMGQLDDDAPRDITDQNFAHFKKWPHKHIIDIEGDWPNRRLPYWLTGSIVTINGLYHEDYRIPSKVFIRPTFSKLLVYLAKNDFSPANRALFHSYGFKGLPDPHGLRQRMKAAFRGSNLPNYIEFNPTWNGPTSIWHPIVTAYQNVLKEHSLALCPRGNGRDSVRFFEACFFGRVPVVIGSNILFGSYYTGEKDFVKFIWEDISEETMRDNLQVIYKSIDEDTAWAMGQKARAFFDKYVRAYFADPTLYFITNCLKGGAHE